MTQVASAPLQAVFPVQTNTRGVTYASLPEAVVSCKATDAGQYTPGSLFGADDPNSATSADSSLDTFRTDSFAGRSGTVQTPCGTLHSGEALQERLCARGSQVPEQEHFRWQNHYSAAARSLYECLASASSGQVHQHLEEAAAEVYGLLRAALGQRLSQVRQGMVDEVLGGSFFYVQQRLVLWCGGLRPSDLIACARISMTADGEKIAPGVLSKVDSLQMACLEHQSAISQGLDDVSARLARLKSVARMVQAQGPRGASTTDLAPKAQSLKDSMAQLMIQADELRIQCLQQMAVLLTPRQLCYYLLAPMDVLQL